MVAVQPPGELEELPQLINTAPRKTRQMRDNNDANLLNIWAAPEPMKGKNRVISPANLEKPATYSAICKSV
jgi:hypothetical protein